MTKTSGKVFPVISEKSRAEFPQGHPAKDLPVLPNDHLHSADVLVCSLAGEPRVPPAPGDQDLLGVCRTCERAVVYRASAPALPRECTECFEGVR